MRRELQLGEDAAAPSRDLAAAVADEPGRTAYFETLSPFYTFGWSPMFGARSAGAKYVLAPKEELFDLAKDPGETKNLPVAANADLARPLVREVGARLEDKPVVKVTSFRPSEAIVQQLQSLGYLAGGKPREEGDWKSAVASRKYPDPKDLADLLPKFAMALGYVAVGQTDGAMAIYDEVERRDPTNAKAALYRAMALMDAGRWKDAESVLRGAIAKHPDDVRAIAKLAIALRQQQRPEEATKLLEAALATGDLANDDRILLGDNYLALGRLDDAAKMAAEVEKADPSSALAPNLAGVVALSRKDYPAAEKLFGESLRRSPDLYYAHKNLALVFLDTKRPAEARKSLEACRRLSPSDPEILLSLAQIDLGEGKVESAIGDIEAAFALDPREYGRFLSTPIDEGEIRLRFAEALASGNRIAEAKKVLSAGAERKKLSAEGLYRAAEMHFATGEVDAGLRYARAGLEAAPGNPSILYSLARGELLAGRPDEARRRVDEAIRKGGEPVRKAFEADPVMAPLREGGGGR